MRYEICMLCVYHPGRNQTIILFQLLIQRGNDGNQITYMIPKHQSINSSTSKLFFKQTCNDLSASMLLPAIKLKRESTFSYTLKHIKAEVVNGTFDTRRKKINKYFPASRPLLFHLHVCQEFETLSWWVCANRVGLELKYQSCHQSNLKHRID